MLNDHPGMGLLALPEALSLLINKRLTRISGSRLQGPSLKALSSDVKDLSDYFTRNIEARPPAYLEKDRFMAAYLAYFLPVNILKISRPLSELSIHPEGLLPTAGELNVLDIGCGPGTASLGLMAYLAATESLAENYRLCLCFSDYVRENLKEAEHLAEAYMSAEKSVFNKKGISSLEISTEHYNMEEHRQLPGCGRSYDLIILSNSLGEMGKGKDALEKRRAIIERLAKERLNPRGSILIIEPALRNSSRNIQNLGDIFRQGGDVNLYSPCIFKGTCMMLENERDWCHEEMKWSAPKIVSAIDDLTGFDKSDIKYSYMILRRDGAMLSSCISSDVGTFRVVSERLLSKGISKVYLCGKDGIMEVSRLDRDKSSSNLIFDDLKRGDIVEIKGLSAKGGGWRIAADSLVRKL